MLLKFVNDTDRSIYAFEMLPPPAVDAPDDVMDQQFSAEDCVANNTVAVVPKSSSQPADVLRTCDIVNDLLLCVTESSRNRSPVPADDEFRAADDDGDRLNNRMESSLSAPLGDVALLESNPDVNWQYNQLTDMATDDGLQEPDSTGFAVNGIWPSCLSLPSEMGCHGGDGEQPASAAAVAADATSSSPPSQADGKASADEGRQTEDGGGDAETSRVADEWKSCAICLEEMEDDQLLVHAECGGTLCPDCHGVRHNLLIS